MRLILTTLALLFLTASAKAQTPVFTFECFSNANMTGDSCDICVGTNFQSRSFSGLMVYRLGVFNKWIDEPYLIRLRPGNSVEFIEQTGTNPDKITIPLSQTGFSTITGFIDSTFCAGPQVQYSFSVSDSLRTTAINNLDTLTFVGRGGSTVFFDTVLQKVVITSPVASGGTNLSFSGTSSPVTLNSSTGTDVTLTAGTAISLSATGTNLTIVNTAPDQTVTLTAGTGISVTGSYPNFTVTNTGDLSVTNEAQTLTAGTNTVTLSAISGVGGGTVTVDTDPTNDITGSGTTNFVPKFTGTQTVGNSQIQDNGTTVYIGGSSALTAARFEANRTYTNTTDANIVASGNIPLLGIRTATARFAIGAGYEANDRLSFLGSSTAANPTTILGTWYADNSLLNINSSRVNVPFGVVNAGGNGNSFGASSAPSGISNYFYTTGGSRTRFEAQSGLAYIDFYTSATGSNRNYSFATGYFNPGDFNLLQSTSAGAAPSNLIFSVQPSGNFGFSTSSPQQTVHIQGTARITGSAGTPTAVMGRDANGDISNLALSGLSISSGTLSVTNASKWTTGTGGIYNTSLDNVSVGSTSVNLSRFRVSGNSANTCARFDAGTLPDFGAVTQLTGSGGTIYGNNYSLNATGNATYLFANSNAGTSANSLIQFQSNGGSPITQYQLTDGSGASFASGIDNSATGNPFKIKAGTNLSGTEGITMLSNGFIGINDDAPNTVLDVEGTDGIDMPSGTTAQRPSGGQIIRFNSTFGGFEALNNSNNVWYRVSSTTAPTASWNSGVIGTGGSVTLATGSNEVAGTIIIATGSNPTGTNTSAISITFSNSYSGAVTPFPIICQANAQTALEWTKFHVGTANSTLFQIGVAAQLAQNSTYRINYRISQ